MEHIPFPATSLYPPEVLTAARRTKARRLWGALLTLTVFLALMVLGLVVRIRSLVILSAVLGACIFYTLLVSKCLPWVRYCRYLSDMSAGRRRETLCYFADLSTSQRVVDGVQIYDVNAATDQELSDLRLFYWDADRPTLSIPRGQRVKITSWGNFILSICPADED